MSESPPRYPILVLETTPDDADAMSGMLDLLGADAIEQRDASTLTRGGAEGVTLVAGFADEAGAQEAVDTLNARGAHARLEFVVGDAWRDMWKAHWKPTHCGRRVVIVPSWVQYEPAPGEIIVPLDPGYAFGTGQHPSTVLAACAIENWLEARGAEPRTWSADSPRVLDVGCGSAILSLIAVILGAGSAGASDIDLESVNAAKDNVRLLGFSDRIEVRQGSASAFEETAPLVVANIEAVILIPMAAELAKRVAPGGRVVLSGILEVQRDEVVRAYEAVGLTLAHCEQHGDWICPEFTRA